MNSSARILTLIWAFLFVGAIASPMYAQSSPPINVPYPCHLASTKNIQKELVKPLQSSSYKEREEALQKVILYATHHGASLDLTPTVNSLLRIYAKDRYPQFQLMAVQALYQIGDVRGMEELYALSQRAMLSPRTRKVGRNASRLYFSRLRHNQLLEHHEKLVQRHAEKVEKYRKRVG